MAERSRTLESWRLGLAEDRQVYAFLASMISCVLYVFCFTGPGNVIVLIDTFLPAGMLAMALSEMTQQQTRMLKSLVQSLLVLNSLVALLEVVSQSHLVPIPSQGNDFINEFRPTGLYDHALTGAAATMLGLWLLADCTTPNLKRWLYLGLAIAALLAFGERSPLGVTLLVIALYSLQRCGNKMLIRNVRLVDAVWCIAAPLLVLVLLTGSLNGGVGTRLAAHLYWDRSAQVRLSQFEILASLRPQELFFGCSRTDLLALIEPLRLSTHVAVIENFWLVNFVTLGIVAFPVFVMGFLALLHWLWQMNKAPGRIMIITFVCVASSSNSLGRKSTLLVALVACSLAARPPLVARSAPHLTGGS